MEITNSQLNFFKSQDITCVGVIGKGSYSKVLLCQGGIQTKFKICCKVVTFEKNNDRFMYKFFPREMEILSIIRHPNIIQTYGIYKRNETFFILMRFAEKRDLCCYIIQNHCVPEPRVKFWAWQIAEALSYIHSIHIVHRDIKCENIFLTFNENIRIGDFGFAKRLSDDKQLSDTWCGSLSYTAPEVLMKKSHDARKLDSWSFGVVIYTLLAAKVPFPDKTAKGVILQQRQTLLFNGHAWRDVSQMAKYSIRKLLKVNPDDRWLPCDLLSCSWLAKESRRVLILDKAKFNLSKSPSVYQSYKSVDTSVEVPYQLPLENKVLQSKEISLNYFEFFKPEKKFSVPYNEYSDIASSSDDHD